MCDEVGGLAECFGTDSAYVWFFTCKYTKGICAVWSEQCIAILDIMSAHDTVSFISFGPNYKLLIGFMTSND